MKYTGTERKWSNMVSEDKEILLSVLVAAYNHEKYIRKALDSIIMQQTTFRYEIIVAEDCSKDNTAKILLEYKRKYPDLIRLRLRRKNVGGNRNVYSVFSKMRGKYIATMDGDDYWTDSNKLQKQVTLLEKNPTYSAVVHRCEIVNEHGKKQPVNYNKWYYKGEEYSFKDFEGGVLPGHTASLVCRNFYKLKPKDYSIFYKAHRMVGDQTIYAICLLMGNIYCMKEVMSDYRHVIKRGGTNAASVATYKNGTWEMWLYYFRLEKYIREEWNYPVDFSRLRIRELQNAKNILCNKVTLNNSYIVLKIAIGNRLFNL